MKLHESLAVNTSIETQAGKVRSELANSFQSKGHLFTEKLVTFFPNAEGQPPIIESQSKIQTTVRNELALITPFLVKAIDSAYQIAEANTEARADIILEGETTPILTGIPATSLLELEKRLAEVATLINAISTIDPAKAFVADNDKTAGYYKAAIVNKPRTKKEKVVLIRYAATVEHPAQTELIDKDVEIGRTQEQEWSGLILPVEKSQLLERVEIMQRAVKAARSRANEQLVDREKKIGNTIIGYIFQVKK